MLTVAVVALVSLAFTPQVEARPHVPQKIAHGAGKVLHGAGNVVKKAAHPFGGKGIPGLRRLRG